MTYREALSQHAVAISISDSADMPSLGLSVQHLQDAMTEVTRHLLALGSRVMYGGDLRAGGFTELLFELVARHRRDADEGDERASAVNYLAWPVHIQKTADDLEKIATDLRGAATLILLDLEGNKIPLAERKKIETYQPIEREWSDGLTAMRIAMLNATDARIVIGGRVEHYKGIMPGIAEETLLSLKAGKPIYILGGFGGCSRDIAEALGLIANGNSDINKWPKYKQFIKFNASNLNNGLLIEENRILAQTPHIDQAVALILRGLIRLEKSIATKK